MERPEADASGRWTGRPPAAGHISHAPRPSRSGHTGPQLSANSSGAFRALPHPGVSGAPHTSGSHPATSGRRRVPWYSDEQDLSGPRGLSDDPEERQRPSMPPAQQSGGWRQPPSGSQSGPRPGNWMNDLR